jgi:vacuolar-type H+-ATPase subunit H
MDILYLVDRLEELLNGAWHIPLTSNVMMDEDELLDIIDQMRMSVPEEVKQAKRIQQERDRLIAQAQEEKERIIGLAREDGQAMLDEHEIRKVAEAERQAILQESQREAEMLKTEADAYVLDVLSRLDAQLSGFLTQVRNGLNSIDKAPSEPVESTRSSERQ